MSQLLRLCMGPKGYPDGTLFALAHELPADRLLQIERVSRHCRLEISAVERIKFKYLPQPPKKPKK